MVRDATAAFAAVGAACAALLAGCGGEEGSAPPPEAQPEGLSARVADCRDWNAASAEVRLATVESIREYAGGPTTGGSGATLEDEEAYDLFEGWCSNDFARRFKLYKLYSRAAAFRSLAP